MATFSQNQIIYNGKGTNTESTIHKTGLYASGEQVDSESIGTYHYADASRLFELQRKNNFELIVLDINNLYQAGQNTTADSATYFSDGEDVLRLTTYSSPIPHFTQDPIKIKRGNNEIKYAGVPTFKSGQIKVYDTIGPDTKGLLMAWQNLSYDVETEKVGLSSDYKKTAILTEYTPDWQVVRQWKMVGCWISGISEEDADWTQGTNKTITATMEYDKAFLVTNYSEV